MSLIVIAFIGSALFRHWPGKEQLSTHERIDGANQ